VCRNLHTALFAVNFNPSDSKENPFPKPPLKKLIGKFEVLKTGPLPFWSPDLLNIPLSRRSLGLGAPLWPECVPCMRGCTLLRNTDGLTRALCNLVFMSLMAVSTLILGKPR